MANFALVCHFLKVDFLFVDIIFPDTLMVQADVLLHTSLLYVFSPPFLVLAMVSFTPAQVNSYNFGYLLTRLFKPASVLVENQTLLMLNILHI